MPEITLGAAGGAGASFRRYVFILFLSVLLPAVTLAAFVIGIDPYYVFGAPSWKGINVVRPYYEPHVIIAKPYQARRMRPEAVALGSSRVEVGIDPAHPGWQSARTFNFAMPSSTIYDEMLAFTHAQAVGAPLRRAVIGLDFFGFNIFMTRNQDQKELRFAGDGVPGFARYLQEELPSRRPVAAPSAPKADDFNEKLYLAVNPDVAAAVRRKDFKSGREHYELAGRAERRLGATIPPEWDEAGYLQAQPDVAYFSSLGNFVNGYHHYLAAGRAEGRLGGLQPAGWDEANYLAVNPAARIQVAFGYYRSGFVHYAAAGKAQGLMGGLRSTNILNWIRLRSPSLNKAMFQLTEAAELVFSSTAVNESALTLTRQSEAPSFDESGSRIWAGQDATLAHLGGGGRLFRDGLTGWQWYLWLRPPTWQYCFTNNSTGITMFDPFRYLLRRAYADGTDLRMFVTPLHVGVRQLLTELGLSTRYDYWLKELFSINEQEANRAGRPTLQLWDFSDTNSITTEPIPVPGNATPMLYYWQYSHYRRASGDLMLDRIFDYKSSRTLPDDFGVRLTSANIENRMADSDARRRAWAENNDLAKQIYYAAHGPKAENRQSEAACW